jgi:hypothetical protein
MSNVNKIFKSKWKQAALSKNENELISKDGIYLRLNKTESFVNQEEKTNIEKKNITEEVAEKRFNICKDCPELIQLTKTCKKCGCFMQMKTKLEHAVCPIGKW